MEERTADEIAQIFSAAGDSVTVINTAKASGETDDEYKDKIKRNVEPYALGEMTTKEGQGWKAPHLAIHFAVESLATQ